MESQENNNLITPVYLRERAGKTQMQLAVDLKRTTGTISNWERGTKRPVFDSPEEIQGVMNVYQCSFQEFVEAFKDAQIKITLAELKRFLDQSGISFEDWGREIL